MINTDELIQCLRDAGCEDAAIAEVCRLYEKGESHEAIRKLRIHRCHLMDTLHRSQDRVDCLDYLIREMRKEEDSSK